MKKYLISVVVAYLFMGLVFAIASYSHDLRTFRCDDLDAPHGYETRGTVSYANPDPERCVRLGFTLKSIVGIPIHTIFGVPILVQAFIIGD